MTTSSCRRVVFSSHRQWAPSKGYCICSGAFLGNYGPAFSFYSKHVMFPYHPLFPFVRPGTHSPLPPPVTGTAKRRSSSIGWTLLVPAWQRNFFLSPLTRPGGFFYFCTRVSISLFSPPPGDVSSLISGESSRVAPPSLCSPFCLPRFYFSFGMAASPSLAFQRIGPAVSPACSFFT